MKRALLLMWVALIGGNAAAQQPAADPWQGGAAARQRHDILPHPLLWAATKNGVTTYLLGTIHVGVDAEAQLPDVVFDKLDASPAFAMETDLNDPVLGHLGERTGGGTLHDELGPVYWRKLEAALSPGIARRVDDKTAVIAATLLSLKDLPPTPPMDGTLHARASVRKKRLVYLEPAATEARVLEDVMDLKMLKSMLDEPAAGPKQLKEMLDAYLAGDPDAIARANDGERAVALAHGYTAAEYDAVMDKLLYQRNAAWIAPIEKLHAAGGGFVAVGALHLSGKRSVLELLAQRGFAIERVAVPPPCCGWWP